MRNTWFVDIDGTIVEHKNNEQLDERLMVLAKKQSFFINGKSDIKDAELLDEKILPGVKDFWLKIPEKDVIILTTAREHRHRWLTEQMLKFFDLRYDQIIFAIGSEKRFLINDREPFKKGRERPSMNPLKDKAIAINVGRNEGLSSSSWVFTHT